MQMYIFLLTLVYAFWAILFAVFARFSPFPALLYCATIYR